MIPCVNFTFMTSNVTHKIWADGLGGGGSPSSYMKSKHVLPAPRTGGAGGGASFSNGPGAEANWKCFYGKNRTKIPQQQQQWCHRQAGKLNKSVH